MDLPKRMARLPKDNAGRPVPYFVAWVDGKPDFRIVDAVKLRQAVQLKLCMVCGNPLGANASFVIGPMCAVNHVSSEPPSHLDCATWSACNCPFLANPMKVRREGHLPEGHHGPPGVAILRNPGVTLVWSSRRWYMFKVPNGYLWDIGKAESVGWYCQGRDATRDEVLEAIASGLPILQAEAEQEGQKAVDTLSTMVGKAMLLVPS